MLRPLLARLQWRDTASITAVRVFRRRALAGGAAARASGRRVSLTDTPEAIVIADYGSSEGRNSLAPMTIAIGRLRDRVGPNRAIAVVHTDLPGNDFNALFETLANDPDSYLRDDPAVFASAVGRSYYQTDFAIRQRHTRMDLVGLALAEPNASTDPRSRARRL